MDCVSLVLLYTQLCYPLEVKFETKEDQEYEVEIPDNIENDQDFDIVIPKEYRSYPPTISNRIISDKESLNEDLDVFGHSHGIHHSGQFIVLYTRSRS